MTLVELLVSMAIFTILVSVVMGGVVIMSRNTVRTDMTVAASDGVRTAFQRMDRQVRYAEAINFPGSGADGRRYVEFRVGATVSANGKAMCTQWRWDPTTGRVERRSWEDKPSPSIPGFSTIVSDVQAPLSGGADPYPFRMVKATDANPRQRLVMRLRVGDPSFTRTVESESEFVARNSSKNSLTNNDSVSAGVSDIPVCMAGGRP
ncbi:PulJ/GspJ family protein [Cellulomonas biazotea]|uniref:Uncharacterized protein n=1 Tax=Cellulomonas biazotea TaxID=1709 RepID=A0A402DT73_9CELL|nr:type II secretion system protein [Cellulomonas biazotea]GCE77349.1 hypothetical protein CBZ_24050 [Cellulomonas biazotea]